MSEPYWHRERFRERDAIRCAKALDVDLSPFYFPDRIVRLSGENLDLLEEAIRVEADSRAPCRSCKRFVERDGLTCDECVARLRAEDDAHTDYLRRLYGRDNPDRVADGHGCSERVHPTERTINEVYR